ncbi:MAG: hypothetical protein WC421_02160 [Elusimicrobiales bacterium]
MPTASLNPFSMVPRKDYLSFFNGRHPRYKKILSFTDFQKKDVAFAAGIPVASVRYDNKLPAEVETRFREWATLLNLVAEHFRGDADKTALWFVMPNPMLGNIAPRDMIRMGRFNKLLKFIVNAMSENQRP